MVLDSAFLFLEIPDKRKADQLSLIGSLKLAIPARQPGLHKPRELLNVTTDATALQVFFAISPT